MLLFSALACVSRPAVAHSVFFVTIRASPVQAGSGDYFTLDRRDWNMGGPISIEPGGDVTIASGELISLLWKPCRRRCTAAWLLCLLCWDCKAKPTGLARRCWQ